MIGAAALLSLAVAMPVQEAAAQDVIGGAIVGGAVGGLVGGAVTGGRGSGVAAGVAIGATTGALIGAEAQRRRGGLYWWKGNCYVRDGYGTYYRVARKRCT
jgi:uncharacterized protein YcfJ